VRAIVFALLLASTTARADELCRPGAKYHGAPIDLDVKDADIHELFRLLADVGHVNLVVPDDVSGKVTIKLRRVPWDQAACAIAATHHLAILVDGNILIIQRQGTSR
jgi:type II secretory pathway component HofQ